MLRKLLLTAALLVAPSIAHADWYEASSKHFVVYSDDSEGEVRVFTERLERFDQALRKITGTPDKPISPSARVTVFVVKDVSEIQKLARMRNVAGFFQGRAWGSVAFVPKKTSGMIDAQAVLLHEYGHNFMFSTWSDVAFAPWFVEGFAEFVGTAIFRNDGTIVLGKNPEHRSYSISKQNVLPAERLVRMNPGKLDMYETDTLYARGWLLTHYLLLGGHADQLLSYIGAINAGKSVEESNKAFGDIGALDAKLTAYAKRKSLNSIALNAADLPVGDVQVRPLSAGGAAIMPARIISSNGVDAKAAADVVVMARSLAAAYPNDAMAQNELAEAEFDAKNYAAAAAAADRALAVDPKSVHALLYRGMAGMEIAKKDKETSVGTWKDIRSYFLRANKLETEYAQPLILYYESFAAAGERAPESAQNGLLYAYVLAPYDMRLRAQAGRLLLETNHPKEARVAFELLAYSPHAGEQGRKRAQDVLAAIDAGDTKAAVKALKDAEEKDKEREKEDEAKKNG